MKKRGTGPKLYGTKQVAEVLGIPEWRVRNFNEGEAYRLPPSQAVGTGRGSRRLYDAPDIFRLAVANELVNYGFSPEAVGRAVLEIPPSKLRASSEEENKPGMNLMLICLRGEWDIWKMHEVEEFLQQNLGDPDQNGIFLLDFQKEIDAVWMKMTAKTETAALPAAKTGEKR